MPVAYLTAVLVAFFLAIGALADIRCLAQGLGHRLHFAYIIFGAILLLNMLAESGGLAVIGRVSQTSHRTVVFR